MCCNCNRLLITEIPLVACQCAQLAEGELRSEAAEENLFLLEQGSSQKAFSIFTFYTDLFWFVLLAAKSGAQLGLLLIQLVKNYSEHSERVSKLSIKRKTFP